MILLRTAQTIPMDIDFQIGICIREHTFILESITDVIRHTSIRWFWQICLIIITCQVGTVQGKLSDKNSKNSGRQEDHSGDGMAR